MMLLPTREEQPKLWEMLDRLPAELRQDFIDHPDKLAAAAQAQYRVAQTKYPTMLKVPNVAEERFLRGLRKPHLTYKDFPFVSLFLAANGVGKTATATTVMAGVSLGPEFLNADWYQGVGFFEKFKALRQSRKVHCRLVCDAQDMEENGSVLVEIRKWIPTAKISGKAGRSYYRVEIGDVIWDVKTFDMDSTAHAGSNLDLVIFNEPPPQTIWNENIARLRGGGYAMAFLTPLNSAGYLWSLINSGNYPDGEIHHIEATIWENCKDVEGSRGVLSREHIDRQIRQWQETCPDEVEARTTGKFQFLSGACFKIFSKEVHVVKPFDLGECVVTQIVDPHDRKPPFGCWIAHTAGDMHYVVAEYPQQSWNQIKGTDLSIDHFCGDFKNIELGKVHPFEYMANFRVVAMIGDPNKFPYRYPNTSRTVQQEYAIRGRHYDCSIDDALDIGYDLIRQKIFYQRDKVLSAWNCPRFYIFDTCPNMIKAFQQHGWKQSRDANVLTTELDPTWMCPVSTVRYYFMKFGGASYTTRKAQPSVDGGEVSAEYRKVLESLHPAGINREKLYAPV